MRSLVAVCVWVVLPACAAQQTPSASDTLFASPAAELAKERAPDLHRNAEIAWFAADQAEREGAEQAADDLRTEARLWLAAAAAEAERVELDRHRMELQAEEERWAKQLARDQAAAGVVAQDISRYEARSVASRSSGEHVNGLLALVQREALRESRLDGERNRRRAPHKAAIRKTGQAGSCLSINEIPASGSLGRVGEGTNVSS